MKTGSTPGKNLTPPRHIIGIDTLLTTTNWRELRQPRRPGEYHTTLEETEMQSHPGIFVTMGGDTALWVTNASTMERITMRNTTSTTHP